ncbi:MAG TPA: DUF4190 domain-containing protein [Verrucomicrobiae bacterium]|jgi:hypothetical protein
MSEFRFFCPECGQKVLGDTAYSGTQVPCPVCQKSITIPAAPAAAPANVPPTASQSTPPPPASPKESKQPSDRLSKLAAASLICSVVVPLGAVPGLICGHVAKARMRRNVFLVGEKMANAGLLISYCVLLGMLALAGTAFLGHLYNSPTKVVLGSANDTAADQSQVVDDVAIGDSEDDHDENGQMDYTSNSNGKAFRAANRGGEFSYTMKVLPDQAMVLSCRYWGGEKKDHVFDIAVDDQIIAAQDLTTLAPGHFVDVKYKIPSDLTRGKTQVNVMFQAHPRMTAGGLYGCQILK